MKRMILILMVMAAVMTSCGGGGDSPSPAGMPEAPANVKTSAGNGQVTVTWEAASEAASFNIYWATTPGVTTGAGTKVEGVSSPFQHTGIQNGTTYYYVVTAVNSAGLESAESAEMWATPLLLPPPPPSD